MFLFPSLIIIFYDYQCQFFLFEIQFSNFRPTDNNYIIRITVLTIFVSYIWHCQTILAFLEYFCIFKMFHWAHPKYFLQGRLSLSIRQFIEDKAGLALDMTWQKIRCDQRSVSPPPPIKMWRPCVSSALLSYRY